MPPALVVGSFDLITKLTGHVWDRQERSVTSQARMVSTSISLICGQRENVTCMGGFGISILADLKEQGS